MKAYTLLRKVQLYPFIQRYQFKKDVPKNAGTIIALDFGLWGIWHAVKGFAGIKMRDGSEVPFHIMYASNGEVVIGPHDLEAGAGTKHEQAWRESYAVTIEERLARVAADWHTQNEDTILIMP